MPDLNRTKRNLAGGIHLWIVIILALLQITGCAETALEQEDDFLIRVGDRIVTVDDFLKAFENVKNAYPHHVIQDSKIIKRAQLRLLNQMTEEMLLLERAEELQVVIPDSEFEKALKNIKEDYPEGVFDQMLLEYAVSYRFWKERLKVRLLMEKVVARELADRITISAEDISSYYKRFYHDNDVISSLTDEASKDINEMIVNQLRREKAEQVYQSWLKELREKYQVEINQAKWKAVCG